MTGTYAMHHKTCPRARQCGYHIRMTPTARASLYAHVHILFWPWLWWQLLRLDAWIAVTGRSVLFSVDRCGNLYWRHIADDPDAPRPWAPSPPQHLPWNPYPTACSQLARLGAGLAYDPTRHGDQALLACWLLSVYGHHRQLPIRARQTLALSVDIPSQTAEQPP